MISVSTSSWALVGVTGADDIMSTAATRRRSGGEAVACQVLGASERVEGCALGERVVQLASQLDRPFRERGRLRRRRLGFGPVGVEHVALGRGRCMNKKSRPPGNATGAEVPAEVVDALGEGERPQVGITINGHRWRSRVAFMGGRRFLVGISAANRAAAGVAEGDERSR